MRKLKSEFRKDEAKTQMMKVFFNNTIDEEEKKYYEFIGVYYYKIMKYFLTISQKIKKLQNISV